MEIVEGAFLWRVKNDWSKQMHFFVISSSTSAENTVQQLTCTPHDTLLTDVSANLRYLQMFMQVAAYLSADKKQELPNSVTI